MPLTLNDFIGHIKRNSVARPNKYDIIFTLPFNLVGYLSDGDSAGREVASNDPSSERNAQNPVGTERMMALSCLSAELPTVGALTSDTNYGNYTRRIAYDKTPNVDFHTTFIVTGEMNEKRLFDAWQAIMFQQKTHRMSYYDDYVTSISVECHNNANKTVYHFELTEAYPLSVGVVQLDRTSQNTQMLLEVTWAFHKIKLDPNKYDIRDSNDADVNATYDELTQNNGTSARELNLVPVPDNHYAQIEVNDILKAAGRIREQVKRGDISPLNALSLIRGLSRDFKALTGIEDGVFEDVTKFLGDLGAGMPIKIPGIGNVPTKLPF